MHPIKDSYLNFHVFKVLERVMYNRICSYLTENNISFINQIGFRAGYSTEHALLELVDQISNTTYQKLLILWTIKF